MIQYYEQKTHPSFKFNNFTNLDGVDIYGLPILKVDGNVQLANFYPEDKVSWDEEAPSLQLETLRLQEEIDQLGLWIDKEITDRIAQGEKLQGEIDDVKKALQKEISDRKAEDKKLEGEISDANKKIDKLKDQTGNSNGTQSNISTSDKAKLLNSLSGGMSGVYGTIVKTAKISFHDYLRSGRINNGATSVTYSQYTVLFNNGNTINFLLNGLGSYGIPPEIILKYKDNTSRRIVDIPIEETMSYLNKVDPKLRKTLFGYPMANQCHRGFAQKWESAISYFEMSSIAYDSEPIIFSWMKDWHDECKKAGLKVVELNGDLLLP